MFAGVMVDDQECKEVSVSWNETSEGLMEWNVGKRAYIWRQSSAGREGKHQQADYSEHLIQ